MYIKRIRTMLQLSLTSLACISVLLSPGSAMADKPVLQLDRHQYTWKDLYGIESQKLRAEFNAGVKNLPIERLRQLFGFHNEVGIDVFAMQKVDDRPKLVETFWKAYTRNLALQAARMLVRAHVTENIVKLHQVNLSDYFDAISLREAHKRDVKSAEFFFNHRNEPPEKDAELFAQSVHLFGTTLPLKSYAAQRAIYRHVPEFEKNREAELFGCLEQVKDDFGIKALIMSDILRQACEEGVYYTKAKERFHAQHALVEVFEITDYHGSRAILEAYFAQVIDKEGDVAAGGIKELREWLNAGGQKARLKHHQGLGSMVLNQSFPSQDDKRGGVRIVVNPRITAIPTSGKVYETGADAYRVYAIHRKTPKNDERFAPFYKEAAYQMAVAPYLPEVSFFMDDWSVTAEELVKPVLQLLASDCLHNVKLGKYVKKPYPGAFFAEWEECRDKLDDLSIQAAKSIIIQDRKTAAKLVEDIKKQSEKAKTAAVRNAYLGLSNRLSAKLKLIKE